MIPSVIPPVHGLTRLITVEYPTMLTTCSPVVHRGQYRLEQTTKTHSNSTSTVNMAHSIDWKRTDNGEITYVLTIDAAA